MVGRKASGSELLAALGALAVLVATTASQSELTASLWTWPGPAEQRGAGCLALEGIRALDGACSVCGEGTVASGHCSLPPLQIPQATPLQAAGASMVRALVLLVCVSVHMYMSVCVSVCVLALLVS